MKKLREKQIFSSRILILHKYITLTNKSLILSYFGILKLF